MQRVVILMKKKLVKEDKKIKFYDILFLISLGIILILTVISVVFFKKTINYYENRSSYYFSAPTIENIKSGEFQKSFELALSDQILMSTRVKKIYNFFNNYVNILFSNFVFKTYCNDNYIKTTPNSITFGCDNNLVYEPIYITNDNKSLFDNRISNINNLINKSPVPVYTYYIEKDTDINFKNNEKTNVSGYIYKNILDKSNFNVFHINNFSEFQNYFYKTDHHWNYMGSYEAYNDLANTLNLGEVIKSSVIKCNNSKFSGSKASIAGSSYIYKEDFCAYVFDFPEHITYINGEKVNDYGSQNNFEMNNISYGMYYGGDDAEIIFDYNNPTKENILIIGESYDNAILKLISTHYNKTFSIDLRHYERQFGKKFNYLEYIKKNNINKTLLIGNIDFYRSQDFDMEV